MHHLQNGASGIKKTPRAVLSVRGVFQFCCIVQARLQRLQLQISPEDFNAATVMNLQGDASLSFPDFFVG